MILSAAQPSPWFVSSAGVAIIALALVIVAAVKAYILYNRYGGRRKETITLN